MAFNLLGNNHFGCNNLGSSDFDFPDIRQIRLRLDLLHGNNPGSDKPTFYLTY